jgi:hypothetical protein
METTMKNTFKKLTLIIATAAIFFVGAANVFAGDNISQVPSTQGHDAYQRFLDVETGNGNF